MTSSTSSLRHFVFRQPPLALGFCWPFRLKCETGIQRLLQLTLSRVTPASREILASTTGALFCPAPASKQVGGSEAVAEQEEGKLL